MKSIRFIGAVLLSMFALSSCNSGDDSAVLTLEHTALYFASWDSPAQSVAYVASNAESVAVSGYSEGWEAYVDGNARQIVVRPVGATTEGTTNADLSKDGYVTVNALNKKGEASSYYIYLYISESINLDNEGSERANCYIATKALANYTFDAMHRPDGSELATESIQLLWQSNPKVISHAAKSGNNAQFFVNEESSNSGTVSEANAVIAAYNSAGEVIWSWHIWVTNNNPLLATDTYSNGKSFMRQNLGAFTNSNGEADEQKILDSYGMYYQWGRKDPFPRPLFFDASGAYNEDRYNANGTYISEVVEELTSSIGTINYTTKYPMQFITNASCIEEDGNGVGDWLASGDNTLWSESQKGLYDPCPYGWRVPTAEDLEVLHLADAEDTASLETLRKQYGWHLSDGVSTYFYPACGRRRYTDSKVENMNYYTKEEYNPSLDYDPQPQPWAGYYWTSTTDASGKAVAMYFDLRTTRTINKLETNRLVRKANGLQVRCVKE